MRVFASGSRTTFALVVSLCLLGLSFASETDQQSQTASAEVKAWRNKMTQEHLKLPRSFFWKIQTKLELIDSLKRHLAEQAFTQEQQKILQELSDYLKFPITTREDAKTLLEFFADSNLSGATKASAFLLFLNFLMVLASIALILSGGIFFWACIEPVLLAVNAIIVFIIEKTPLIFKKVLLFGVSLFLIPLTKAMPTVFHAYFGLFSTILISIALRYLMFNHRKHQEFKRSFENSTPQDNVAMVLTFGIGAIIFDSSLIGFITVLIFYITIGFIFYSFWGIWCFGFQEKEQVVVNVVFSGFLLAAYNFAVLAGIKSPFFHIFSTGIFFCSTFVYFLGLLILQNRSFESPSVHLLTIVSGLVCFLLGSLSPELTVFRGVGTTFFTLYLMEMISVVRWGDFWILGLFIGSSLVLGYAALAQKYWTYFI